MEMTGEFRIPAPRQRVWEALNDPQMLKQAIPGCQSIEKASDTEFAAKVVAKVGPVKATFGGKVTLSDLDPPKAYTIAGEGSGGVAGFAKGSARVSLDEDGEATLLHYEVQAHVGGKLAQIGSRLIDATSRKMAEEFFTRFAAVVVPEAADGSGSLSSAGADAPLARIAAGLEAAGTETAPSAAEALPGRLSPAVWVTGLTAIVGLMLYYFTRSGGLR
ncbi:MAG: SRPBCC family protein [Stellaceae bacterium]